MDTLAGLISAKDGGIREVAFSPDGRFAVLRNDAWDTKRDLWLLPLGARGSRGRPVPLERTPFNELMPRVSPDSRHLAFVADLSGELEVYVRPFPGPGQKLQVSDGGGTEPVWAPDGRGLFYRAAGKVMLATLSATAPLRVLDRKVLFEDRYLAHEVRQQYDVMPDGRRLLMLEPIRPDDQEGQAVFVVLGWTRELREQLRPTR
jgi:serine/threonine-protein kinase